MRVFRCFGVRFRMSDIVRRRGGVSVGGLLSIEFFKYRGESIEYR